MNTVDLDDIVKKETRFGPNTGAPKVERREDPPTRSKHLFGFRVLELISEVDNATQSKYENQSAAQAPEAIKRRQIEQARMEQVWKQDEAERTPVVNGVSLRRKSDLGCKQSINSHVRAILMI